MCNGGDHKPMEKPGNQGEKWGSLKDLGINWMGWWLVAQPFKKNMGKSNWIISPGFEVSLKKMCETSGCNNPSAQI